MKKKYNWGILGPGWIAHKFASDLKLLPNAQLYAVGSRDLGRAKDFARQYGATKAYGSYEEVANDPDVDIVYIASPHTRHYADSLLCLEQGKAVLCEKPLAMNVAQCLKMIEKAREKNVFFMEALWTRFLPSFIKCLDLINEGAIGEVKLIDSDFCYKAAYNTEGRLFNPLLGGGSLLDIGIYPAFLALEIGGQPQKIHAAASIGKTGVDESCSILLNHKNNIVSVLYCSLVVQGLTESVIYGSEGRIKINSMWHIPTTLDLFDYKGSAHHYKFKEPGNGYQYEAVEVMKCIDEGRIESEIFSWQKSIALMGVLDTVRTNCGINYPLEVERT